MDAHCSEDAMVQNVKTLKELTSKACFVGVRKKTLGVEDQLEIESIGQRLLFLERQPLKEAA